MRVSIHIPVPEFKFELTATSVSYNNAKIHHKTHGQINLNLVYTYNLAEQYSREKTKETIE